MTIEHVLIIITTVSAVILIWIVGETVRAAM